MCHRTLTRVGYVDGIPVQWALRLGRHTVGLIRVQATRSGSLTLGRRSSRGIHGTGRGRETILESHCANGELRVGGDQSCKSSFSARNCGDRTKLRYHATMAHTRDQFCFQNSLSQIPRDDSPGRLTKSHGLSVAHAWTADRSASRPPVNLTAGLTLLHGTTRAIVGCGCGYRRFP